MNSGESRETVLMFGAAGARQQWKGKAGQSERDRASRKQFQGVETEARTQGREEAEVRSLNANVQV